VTESQSGWSSWSAALDGLEASVIVTEELLRNRQSSAEPEPWEAPTDLGALPPELVERARSIAERQRAILSQLPTVVETTQRQRDLTRRITDATTPRHGSIYVDTTA